MPLSKLPELALADVYLRSGMERDGYSFEEFLQASRELHNRDSAAELVEDLYDEFYGPAGVSREDFSREFEIEAWEDKFPGYWTNRGRKFKDRSADLAGNYLRTMVAPQAESAAEVARRGERAAPRGGGERKPMSTIMEAFALAGGTAPGAGGVPAWPQDYKASAADLEAQGQHVRMTAKDLIERDYGYDPEADPQWAGAGGWQEAKSAVTVFIDSAPDMIALMQMVQAYEDRMEMIGKRGDDATDAAAAERKRRATERGEWQKHAYRSQEDGATPLPGPPNPGAPGQGPASPAAAAGNVAEAARRARELIDRNRNRNRSP